jgi:hypothetical protein
MIAIVIVGRVAARGTAFWSPKESLVSALKGKVSGGGVAGLVRHIG